MEVEPQQKTHRTRSSTDLKERVILEIEPTDEMIESHRPLALIDEDGMPFYVPYSLASVRMKPTEEEKRERNRESRRKYAQSEKGRKKAEERARSQAVIKKRKEYSMKPTTKKRKRELAQIKRRMLRILQREHRMYYEALFFRARSELNIADTVTDDGK